jgi:type II restriction enzyme
VFTESWVAAWLFCPNCGERRISPHVANRPVADLHCAGCREEFELKSQRGRFGAKVLDGAYGAKMARLARPPSLRALRVGLHRVSPRSRLSPG